MLILLLAFEWVHILRQILLAAPLKPFIASKIAVQLEM